MTEKEFIEEIRKTRFNIGDQSSKGLQDFANRAVEKLADELYAKDTHFVLELLQNADDNKYPVDAKPSIVFEVSPFNLVIKNNELGFTERNVDALCDVGQSTKKSEKHLGYIGEKGIGFKSVFKISDAPEIHSNGFHFYFAIANEKNNLGYVVPHWIDDSSRSLDEIGTTIVLPAKKGEEYESRFFNDVQPELLLFLRRIQSVIIATDWDKKTRELRKEDKGSLISIYSKTTLEGKEEEKCEHYRIAKYIADVSSIKSKDREGFVKSEISLVFPVNEKGCALFKNTRQVFSFLPVKDCGFKFIIQADLLLTSSREDFQEDDWNKNILNQISLAFVQEALPLFKSDDNLKLGFYGYLQFDRLEDKFKPVVEDIFNLLRDSNCILTMDDGWCTPNKSLIASGSIKDLISNKELFKLIDKEFAAKEICVFEDELEKLGCKYFSLSHLIACLKDEKWVKGHSDNDDWFKKLYSFIASKSFTDFIEDLKDLKIFPLTNGEIVSASEGPIYLPLSNAYYGFEEQLFILRDAVLPAEDDSHFDRIMELLEKINIRKAEPQFIIDDYILEKHSHNDDSFNKKYFLGHISYLKDNLDDYIKRKAGLNPNTLGTKLKLVTKNPRILQKASDLYLSEEYGNKNSLEQLFLHNKGVNFVSAEYLVNYSKSQDSSSWYEFFRKIGVCYLPKIILDNPLPQWVKFLNYGGKYIEVTDASASDEMLKIFESNDRVKKNILLKLVAENWENYYSKYEHVRIDTQFENKILQKKQTNFFNNLKVFKVPINNDGWEHLQNCYQKTSEITAIYGEHLQFIELDLLNYKSFLNATSIKYEVSLFNTLERIKTISESGTEVSRDIISKLYKVLEYKLPEAPHECKGFFEDHSVIYISKHQKHWFKASEVCWAEHAHRTNKIISSHYPSLKSEYRENESFFLQHVGVQEHRNPEQLIDVLRNLVEEPASDKEKSDAAQKIYLELEGQLRLADENNEQLPEWVHYFAMEALFWTHENELWKNDNDILINDSPIIGDLFKDSNNFTFLAVDHNVIPQLELFFKEAKLPLLSKEVSTALLPSIQKELLTPITKNINNKASFIARYFYSHHNRDFDRLIKSGRLKELSTMQVFKVEELILKLKVRGQETTAHFNCAVIQGHIYVDADICNDSEILNYEVANEIAKIFEKPDSAPFIYQILSTTNKGIMSRMDVEFTQLPDDIRNILAGKSNSDYEFFENKDEIDVTNTEELKPIKLINVVAIEPSNNELDADINKPAEHADSGEEIKNDADKLSKIINHDVAKLDHTEEIAEELPTSTTAKLNSAIVQNDLKEFEDNNPIKNIDFEDSFETNISNEIDSEPRINVGNTESGKHSEARQNRIEGTITLKDNKRRGQGLSYVGSEEPKKEQNDTNRSEKDMQISKAAVSFVKKEEESDGFIPIEQDHFNPGYDIYSTKGDVERFIEVKGTDGPWTEYGVSFSPEQIHFAKVNKNNCWFYIVEYATSSSPKLYKIQNPFEKITHFRFDNGWKNFACKSVQNKTKLPEVGLSISLKDINMSGIIIKVNKPGTLVCRIWVKLENGETKEKLLYNPSTMILE